MSNCMITFAGPWAVLFGAVLLALIAAVILYANLWMREMNEKERYKMLLRAASDRAAEAEENESNLQIELFRMRNGENAG